ncbi:MAG: hypothetical protein BWY28_00607 [bacterium ADurb.Bin236]|nr:MAG: hypothetical protein BWY28_00607 [bacterium ADurb.Bin236]HPN93764.1 hypothetical protein [bacterium]
MRIVQWLRVIAAIAVSVCASRAAFAAAEYSIRMESKEIIYDIEKQTAVSWLKTVVDGNGYRVTADRVVFDFRSNTLRAEGNVSLYYAYRSGWGMFFMDDMAGADKEERISAREVIINAEFAEALVFPEREGRAPVALDLELGRFTPALRGMDEAPAFPPISKEDVALCYELYYQSSGKFILYDATYIDKGGKQYYSSALMSDGPDLRRRTASLRGLEISDSGGVMSTRFEGTVWLQNAPRSATYIDVEYIHTKDEGFSLASPALTHFRSFASFGIIASGGGDERQRNGSAALFGFTDSRNEFMVSYARSTHDYGSELSGENYSGSRRAITAEGTLWREAGRVRGYYADAANGGLTTRLPAAGDSDYKTRARYGHVIATLDPVAMALPGAKFGAGMVASRSKDNNAWTVTSSGLLRLGSDRMDRLTVQPYVFTGAVPVGGATLIHGVSYTATFSDYRQMSRTVDDGIPVSGYEQTAHQSHYETTARARLLAPLGGRVFIDASSEFTKQSGMETSTAIAGLTIAPGARDYAFAGASYDFNSDEWDIFRFDYRMRLKGGARLAYSLRYDLVADEIMSETMGLQARLGGGAMSLSYDESDSLYYLRYNTRNWSSGACGMILD